MSTDDLIGVAIVLVAIGLRLAIEAYYRRKW